MKRFFLIGMFALSPLLVAAEPAPAKTFLSYIQGQQAAKIEAICHAHHDLWMLRGPLNEENIRAIGETDIKLGKDGVFSDIIGSDLMVVEMRDGKVDPSFNLHTVYMQQRYAVFEFITAVIAQDKARLAEAATESANIVLPSTEVPALDEIHIYASVMSMLPVIRTSDPVLDKKSQSVRYKVPLGDALCELTLVNRGGWKVDSSNKLAVPLEFFLGDGEDAPEAPAKPNDE